MATGDVDGGSPVEVPFAGEDTYGRFAWVRLTPGASSVGLSVTGAQWAVDPSRAAEVWLKPGDARAHASRAAATGVVTVHYGRGDPGWGLHLWGDGVAPEARTDWAAPRRPDGTPAT